MKPCMKRFIAEIPKNKIVDWGRRLGLFLYALDRPHRRLVKRNLQFSHPDKPPEELGSLSRRIFENAGITVLEICQGVFMSRNDLLGRFRVRNEEHIVNALKGNKGAIIVSAHLGNWELGLQCFSCHFAMPVKAVARKMRSRRLNQWLHRFRTRFGMEILDKKGALPEMIGTLRKGEVLALLVDQSRRKQGVPVTFFGREATATPAPALLAIRCKSPILPAFCIREADGTLCLTIHRPLAVKRTPDLRSDLQSNTQMITTAVEEVIRKHPEQWFWILRPWKLAYPGLYAEWEARRKGKKKRKAP